MKKLVMSTLFAFGVMPVLCFGGITQVLIDSTANQFSGGSSAVTDTNPLDAPYTYPTLWSSFSSPASFAITQVSLVLDDTLNPIGGGCSPSCDTGTLQVMLAADTGSGPGSTFSTLDVAASMVPGGTSGGILNLAMDFGLGTSGRYWVGLSEVPAPGSGGYSAVQWGFTTNVSGPAYPSTSVASEFNYSSGLSDNASNGGYGAGAYGMKISGSAVPEPTTAMLGLAGLVGIALAKRRRRNS